MGFLFAKLVHRQPARAATAEARRRTDVRQTTETSRTLRSRHAGITTPASDDEDRRDLETRGSSISAPSEPLPVMVWFHGGGNTGGSTADLIRSASAGCSTTGALCGDARRDRGTANYRLERFGFLSHPGFRRKTRSTHSREIRGCSTSVRRARVGARQHRRVRRRSVERHHLRREGRLVRRLSVTSPRRCSRGLFHRAISESGGCTTRQPTASRARATQALDRSRRLREAPDSLACLRSKPVSLLLDNLDGFEPIVDGGFLPDQPRALYDSGNFAQVPYILGSNSDEGTLFLLPDPP